MACLCQVRAHVEAQIVLIAAGKADKAAVVSHTLEQVIKEHDTYSFMESKS
jgi:hypothetical protein